MKKWIYLKSNNPADALALATVVASGKHPRSIVRRSLSAPFFQGIQHVCIDFYHAEEDSELITLPEMADDSWTRKCDTLTELLEEEPLQDYTPYTGFIRKIDDIEQRLKSGDICLLYLFPHPDENLNLIAIDQMVRLLENQGIRSISAGTPMLPCIKGTQDLRDLVDYPVLCSLLPGVSFVITTEPSTACICRALGKPAFVLSQADTMMIDGMAMNDPNQMVNYINFKTKK